MRSIDEREKALNMYFHEGKSYGFVANELKVSKDTIKSWCRRYRVKNKVATRENIGLRKDPVCREKLHERQIKDETSPEARIAKLEMEVDLLRNFLILRGGE